MKIACHKSSDRACRVCEYRYVCDLSAYHKHDDVPGRKPLQVDSILSAASDNPVSSRAVALAIEALRLTIGRWGNIGGNMDDQKDLSARFGSIEELIGLLSERIKAVEESTEGTEEVATDDYQQVTQCQEDWSGEYVITCTKNGSTHLFAGTDVDANYIDVSVSDGTVTVPYDDLVAEACMVKIERFGDNYSLRVVGGANDGKYMYNNSSTNNIKFNDEPQEVVIEWDDNDGVRIHSVGYNTILQMYISSADTRFCFYKTVQNPIVLCKRVYMSADTADIALKTAESAQATASEAKAAANKASDTADTALGEARTAQSKADDALKTAESAQTRMDNLNIESGTGDKSVQLVDSLRKEGTGAIGKRSAAFGRNTIASGEDSFAEGENTFAEGKASHAGGTSGTRASGSASFAHGSGCHAVSKRSVAMGVNCTAGDTAVDASGEEINTDSFAMGKDNRATHKASAVFGGDNRSSRSHQMVVGHDNADNPDALFVVGNGAGKEDAQRSNAFEVLENGNAVVSNDVIFGGGKSLTDELNSKATYESGEMAAADLYAWYANNEYRIEKAQYNLIGDYCMLSLVGVKTIAGWNVVYYSLPVSCAVPAHGFFKTQDGHNCYWAIASEPDTNVMVLRIASLEEGTALTQSAASLQICYKYK